ncbi:3-oxo-5-alpha-steroid 4-dehydrogenase [Nocardia sp. NPDC059764]|uniref:3-oxo-5-alpha-steroid 4-dehydrogenase n=1 Tax=Nocardia sp. NPDC059764 TaxID=3346939 RepID=UPI0036587C7C
MHWYTGNTVYDTVLTIEIVIAALVLVGAFVGQSPYGRFGTNAPGLNLNPKLGWWLMEIPATVAFAAAYLSGPHRFEPTSLVLAGIWMLHYGNRGWFFPLSIRQVPGKKSSFNISVLAIGMAVTATHGYLNGALFSHDYFGHYTRDWLTDPRFLIGLLVYLAGFALLVSSEAIVRNLRDRHNPGATEYKIPHGLGFRYVTSPTYLGEMIAWAGFAILTWALPGVIILAITAANLVPRAFATHIWYQQKFDDYPPQRKALIPFTI